MIAIDLIWFSHYFAQIQWSNIISRQKNECFGWPMTAYDELEIKHLADSFFIWTYFSHADVLHICIFLCIRNFIEFSSKTERKFLQMHSKKFHITMTPKKLLRAGYLTHQYFATSNGFLVETCPIHHHLNTFNLSSFCIHFFIHIGHSLITTGYTKSR